MSVPSRGRNQTESQFKDALRQEGWEHFEQCVPWFDSRDASRTGSDASHVRFAWLQRGTVTQERLGDIPTKSPDTKVNTRTRMSEAARQPRAESARTAVSASVNAHKQNRNSSRSRLGTVCSEGAPRGSISHVAVNMSQEQRLAKYSTAFPRLRMFLRQHQDEEFEYHKV